MTYHYPDLVSASDNLVESNFQRGTTNQKHYPDLRSDVSLVWDFCALGKPVVALPNVGCFLKLDNKSTDNGKLLSIGLVAGTLQGVIYASRHSQRGWGGTPDFK